MIVGKAPYNKVEESFNTQANHDLLKYGPLQLSKFDHQQFPGVVPRTFLGSLIITTLTQIPFHFISKYLKFIPYNIIYLYLTRIILSFLTNLSIIQLSSHFSSTTQVWYLSLTLCQFHICFWGSRFLPNTYALILTNLGFKAWLEYLNESAVKETKQFGNSFYKALGLFGLAGLAFRSEVVILAGFIFLVDIGRKPNYYFELKRFTLLVLAGLITMLTILALTVGVDSYFWFNSVYSSSNFLWPEGYVFFFNAIENKSSAWGVSPFSMYFLNFMPKLAGIAYPLAIIYTLNIIIKLNAYRSKSKGNLISSKEFIVIRSLLIPCLLFIWFMSFHGHKEWRFIIYTVPITNLSASHFLSNSNSKAFKYLAKLFLMMMLLVSIGSAFISSLNYPGGEAMLLLHRHRIISKSTRIQAQVHLDAMTCMTGASRFLELDGNITYSKEESIKDLSNFDYIISSNDMWPSEYINKSKSTYKLVAYSYGYQGLARKPLKSFLNLIYSLLKSPKSIFDLVSNNLDASLPSPQTDDILTNYRPTTFSILNVLNQLTPINIQYNPSLFIYQRTSL